MRTYDQAAMIIKVCGISTEQYAQVASLDVDWIGFNFYEPSPRFISKPPARLSTSIKHIGIFVNHDLSKLEDLSHQYSLDFLQLHGDEDAPYIETAAQINPIIQVVAVHEATDLNLTSMDGIDYLLFDYKSDARGGAGKKWDWTLLDHYTGDTPFILAGGITPEDVSAIADIRHPQFAGIDINSGFESTPGVKDIKSLETFINEIRKI